MFPCPCISAPATGTFSPKCLSVSTIPTATRLYSVCRCYLPQALFLLPVQHLPSDVSSVFIASRNRTWVPGFSSLPTKFNSIYYKLSRGLYCAVTVVFHQFGDAAFPTSLLLHESRVSFLFVQQLFVELQQEWSSNICLWVKNVKPDNLHLMSIYWIALMLVHSYKKYSHGGVDERN